ncbi:hypothetical protein FDK13_33885 [Dyadobacter frigoris]|uniref:Transposase IS66 central domain-containing protein n=1 Tax=Dyadobacter frigoris TaxID=2576211 RepID=A0A4V6Y1S5_9BACT|nr:hypothetical protein FDK13_33885 [Dyadobacter frigoris]
MGAQAFFSYEPGRGGKYPTAMLKDFNGYLQTDGYAGYEGLAQREDIVHPACWAHVRIKFEESISYDKAMAETALLFTQELYAVERQARENGLDSDQTKQLRLKEALPKYNLMGKWISANMSKVLLMSPIGAAFRYAFERWDELGHYCMMETC